MYPLDAKILIVDDSTYVRSNLKASLRTLNYRNIVDVDNARSAQQVFAEKEQTKDPVKLLITDIHMQDMTGLDLIKWLREIERFRPLPIVILTSSQDKRQIVEAAKLGVSHFIIKPFDTATLEDRMKSTWLRHGKDYLEYLRKPS